MQRSFIPYSKIFDPLLDFDHRKQIQPEKKLVFTPETSFSTHPIRTWNWISRGILIQGGGTILQATICRSVRSFLFVNFCFHQSNTKSHKYKREEREIVVVSSSSP